MARLHVFVDTSIFLHILRVPGFQDRNREEEIRSCLKELIEQDALLYLPLTTILETGNHISRIRDGALRRRAAETFVERVQEALDGEAPWAPTFFLDRRVLRQSLVDYPGYAMQSVSFGDFLLLRDAIQRVNELKQDRADRVWIWTLDQTLRAHSPDAYQCGGAS